MKMILAIVGKDDADYVQQGLTLGGFQATKLATTGGFLSAGNTTFIVGVEDSDVDIALEIIGGKSSKRKHTVNTSPETLVGKSLESANMPFEVTVGGATVFVLSVDKFEKL